MHATDCEVMLAKIYIENTVKTICNGFLLPRRNLSGTHTQVLYAMAVMNNKKSYRLLLTLGAHAQRGLRYLVCLSVCLSVRRLANLAVQGTGRPMTATNSFRVARSLILRFR